VMLSADKVQQLSTPLAPTDYSLQAQFQDLQTTWTASTVRTPSLTRERWSVLPPLSPVVCEI